MAKTGHTTWAEAFAHRRPWPGLARGCLVWLFGLLCVGYGLVGFIGFTPASFTRTQLRVAFDVTGGLTWPIGAAWITVGAFAMFTGYCHHDRDKWGATTLTVWYALWGMTYPANVLFHDAPARQLGVALIWCIPAVAFVVIGLLPPVYLHGNKAGTCER